MSGGKGGTQTSAQSIPAWVEGPAKENLAMAKAAGQIGYMPYYGPEVAGLSPMQQQGMQRTQDALSAYGMAPRGSQYQSSLPEQTTMGGVSGYGSGNIFDQAVAELALRNPDQVARYGKVINPNINEAAYTNAANTQLPNYSQSSGESAMPSAPNYWAQREAEVGAAQAFKEQSAQNQKINDALTSFSKMGFMSGILGALTGGTPTQTRAPVVNAMSSGYNDGGGWSGMSDTNSNAATNSSSVYGGGGFL